MFSLQHQFMTCFLYSCSSKVDSSQVSVFGILISTVKSIVVWWVDNLRLFQWFLSVSSHFQGKLFLASLQ